MSKEQPDPVDSPPEGESGESVKPKRKGTPRSKPFSKHGWGKVKVFKHPEYRLPFHLAGMVKGARSGFGAPAWLQVAVECGLVEMGSPSKDLLKGTYTNRIDGTQPPQGLSLEELLKEGLARTKRDLEKK